LSITRWRRPACAAWRPACGIMRCGMLLCAILALSASTAWGEQNGKPLRDYALIFGTVWTPDMHAASGVPILIRRADEKKARWHLVSDRSGEFAQRVPPGKFDYVVSADLSKLKSPKPPKGQTKANTELPAKATPEVRVQINYDERADITLRLPY
jgi:hypothetical protein